jgi:cell division septation protein DedD
MPEPDDLQRKQDTLLELMNNARQNGGPGGSNGRPMQRRTLVVYGVMAIAAIALGYAGGRFLVRSHLVPAQSQWEGHGQTAAPQAASPTPASPQAAVPTPTASAAPAAVPAATPTAVPPPVAQSPTAGAPSSGGYRIQVGAFGVRAYAQDLVNQLRARHYAATVVEVTTGPPHRVWIHGVFDRPAAEQLAARLRRDGFEAIVLRQ